jgi:hypothetical protein
MTNMINNTMFQSIKSALSQNNSNGSKASEILKLEMGNTYTVRLLPYSKDPKKTFFRFYTHGWNSLSTGQYVAALSPLTFSERDPISEERFRILRTGTDADKEKIKVIRRSEKWLVNVLVVNDPVKPENNGKVKMIRYGKQLQKIITDAVEGEEAGDFGPRVFDLGPDGVNLKIKVEKQGDYPSYVSSKFSMPVAISDMDDTKAKKIYDNVHELDKVFQLKSFDELKAMLDEHYHCKDTNGNTSEPQTTKPVEKVQQPVNETSKQSTNTASEEDSIDIKSLLEELDNS